MAFFSCCLRSFRQLCHILLGYRQVPITKAVLMLSLRTAGHELQLQACSLHDKVRAMLVCLFRDMSHGQHYGKPKAHGSYIYMSYLHMEFSRNVQSLVSIMLTVAHMLLQCFSHETQPHSRRCCGHDSCDASSKP